MISNIDSMIKWASGFVDGEGYIQYKQEPYKRIRIEVCNTDFAPIEILHDLFGGKVYDRKPRVSAIGTITKPQKMWVALNEQARAMVAAGKAMGAQMSAWSGFHALLLMMVWLVMLKPVPACTQ